MITPSFSTEQMPKIEKKKFIKFSNWSSLLVPGKSYIPRIAQIFKQNDIVCSNTFLYQSIILNGRRENLGWKKNSPLPFSHSNIDCPEKAHAIQMGYILLSAIYLGSMPGRLNRLEN